MQRQNFIIQLLQDMAADEEYAGIPHLQDPEDFEMEAELINHGGEIPIRLPSSEPSEELELTPSPGLRELPTPDPPEAFDFTHSPEMISPDMYNLQTPEPPEDIEILGIDLSSPEPAIYIPVTTNHESRLKTSKALQVKFCDAVDIEEETSRKEELKVEVVHQQRKTELLASELSVEVQLTPTFELCEGKPNPSKENDTISKQNIQDNISDKENNGVTKFNDTESSEIQDNELKVKQDEQTFSDKHKSSAGNTSSPKLGEKTGEPPRCKMYYSKNEELIVNEKNDITSNTKEEECSVIELIESETTQILPECVGLPNCKENNNLKLLANACDKDKQMSMAEKNTSSLKPKEAYSSNSENTESETVKKPRGSLAPETQRAIKSASPEFGVGALDHNKRRPHKRSNKMKLLSYKSKKKTKLTRLNKKFADADSSDLEDFESAAKHVFKCSALEPLRKGHSPQLSEETPEPITSPKNKRFNRIKLYSNVSKKNKFKTLTRENIASTSKGKKAESSENSELEDQEMTESQVNDLELTELSEGTPEPVRPSKRRRPLRMTLLPTNSKQKNKNLLKDKVETSDLEDSEIDLIVEEMEAFNELTTPEPPNSTELSQSPELSEGTPEPINPSQRYKSPRIKLLPSSGSSARMSLLPTKGRSDRSKWLLSQNSPIRKWRRDSNSPSLPNSSARAQARTAPKARPPIKSGSQVVLPRIVPRTRVLVTPERSTSHGFPTKQVLRTPDRKPKKITSKKYQRITAKKRKWVESVRRQQKRLKSDLSPTEISSSGRETSSDSENIYDSSGPSDDDDDGNNGNEGNLNIGGGGAKGGDGDSGGRGTGGSGSGCSGMSGRGGYSGLEESCYYSGRGSNSKYSGTVTSCGYNVMIGSNGNGTIGGSDGNCDSSDVATATEEDPKPTRFAQYCIYL